MFGSITQVLHVEGMSCQHCAARVSSALEALDGVKKVKVDLDAKEVTIKVKSAIDEATLKKTIEEAGYQFVSVK